MTDQFVRIWPMTIGSNFPPLRLVIAPGDGANITGASLTLIVIKEDGSSAFTAAMTVDSPTEASYDWQGTEFTAEGNYWFQVQCDLASGKRVFVPKDQWAQIRVIDSTAP